MPRVRERLAFDPMLELIHCLLAASMVGLLVGRAASVRAQQAPAPAPPPATVDSGPPAEPSAAPPEVSADRSVDSAAGSASGGLSEPAPLTPPAEAQLTPSATPPSAPMPAPPPPELHSRKNADLSRIPDEPPPDAAPPFERAGPFSQGRVVVPLMLGSAWFDDEHYLVLGSGVGVYAVDGLEVGLNGALWLLGDPLLFTITPQVKYVMHYVPVVKPYLGTFFRHYVVDAAIDNFSSVGMRIGVLLPVRGAFLGLGAVLERRLSCDGRRGTCSTLYPELSFAFSM